MSCFVSFSASSANCSRESKVSTPWLKSAQSQPVRCPGFSSFSAENRRDAEAQRQAGTDIIGLGDAHVSLIEPWLYCSSSFPMIIPTLKKLPRQAANVYIIGADLNFSRYVECRVAALIAYSEPSGDD